MLSKPGRPVSDRVGRTVNTSHINVNSATPSRPKSNTSLVISYPLVKRSRPIENYKLKSSRRDIPGCSGNYRDVPGYRGECVLRLCGIRNGYKSAQTVALCKAVEALDGTLSVIWSDAGA